jgi:hypothetical protein
VDYCTGVSLAYASTAATTQTRPGYSVRLTVYNQQASRKMVNTKKEKDKKEAKKTPKTMLRFVKRSYREGLHVQREMYRSMLLDGLSMAEIARMGKILCAFLCYFAS